MENQNQTGLLKAYSPKEYTFIGFLFSLIPVFIMSFSNIKVLPNGDALKKKMRTFLIIFIILFIANYGVLTWSVVHVSKSIQRNLFSNPSNYLSLMTQSYEKIAPNDIEFAKMIVSNANFIFFLSHLILLIVVIKFTNGNELPIFEEMRKTNKLQVRNMLLPVTVGIAFVIFQYVYSAQFITALAKTFL